jgi:hypothetical protein
MDKSMKKGRLEVPTVEGYYTRFPHSAKVAERYLTFLQGGMKGCIFTSLTGSLHFRHIPVRIQSAVP